MTPKCEKVERLLNSVLMQEDRSRFNEVGRLFSKEKP